MEQGFVFGDVTVKTCRLIPETWSGSPTLAKIEQQKKNILATSQNPYPPKVDKKAFFFKDFPYKENTLDIGHRHRHSPHIHFRFPI